MQVRHQVPWYNVFHFRPTVAITNCVMIEKIEIAIIEILHSRIII